MNVNQLTQKSIEAVQAAQQNANDRGNTEVSQLHLFSALLEQPDGLISSLLTGMGVNLSSLASDLRRETEALPTYSGGTNPEQIYR